MTLCTALTALTALVTALVNLPFIDKGLYALPAQSAQYLPEFIASACAHTHTRTHASLAACNGNDCADCAGKRHNPLSMQGRATSAVEAMTALRLFVVVEI